MACPNCDHTMHGLGTEPQWFWCPRCGAIKPLGGGPVTDRMQAVPTWTKPVEGVSLYHRLMAMIRDAALFPDSQTARDAIAEFHRANQGECREAADKVEAAAGHEDEPEPPAAAGGFGLPGKVHH